MGKALTIGRFPILVSLGSTNLTKCGEDVVNALGELVGDIEDRSMDDTSTLDSSQIRIGQIILMNDRAPSSRSPNPHHLPSIRAREQHIPEVRTGTADDPGGSNDDTVENGAIDHVAFVYRSPSRKWVRGCRGSGIGDDFIAVVAMDPGSRGFDVCELRGVSRANGFYCLGYQVEDLDTIFGAVGCSSIDDRFDSSQQVFPLSTSSTWQVMGMTTDPQ